MPYQSVGTPRFFVSDIQFALKKGLTSGNNYDWTATEMTNLGALFDLNPTSQQTIKASFQHIELPVTNKSINYVAWLGHNFASNTVKAYLYDSASNSNVELNNGDNGNINHSGSTTDFSQFDGFSFHLFDEYELMGDYVQITFNPSTTYTESKLGAMAVGKYYDMPHSPDLSLKLSYDYSGIKTIETFGGASLSNAFYTKPPDWGNFLGAWELDDGHGINKALSRSGRKIYDLSFSFLDDGDVFGANQSLAKTTMATEIADGTPPASAFDSDDLDAENNFNDNLLSGDNFYSQVIHKTNGGQLPFIFQPDKNDNTNMIIAKFDSGFKFDQVANGVYNVKLKIREVW